MEKEKKGYEVKQDNKDYIVLIDLQDMKLVIKCLNKSTGDLFSSKNFELQDLHAMNKYFRIADNIKEIQFLLNTAIEKVKIGLLEDSNQLTIFFYLMLGVDENTIAFPLSKAANLTKNNISGETRNSRLNPNYLEELEIAMERIEGENHMIKRESDLLKEKIKQLYIQSNELKKESMQLKEDNNSLREQNQALLEFKRKYESSISSTPFKTNDSYFQDSMKISSVIDEIINSKNEKNDNIIINNNNNIEKNDYIYKNKNYPKDNMKNLALRNKNESSEKKYKEMNIHTSEGDKEGNWRRA